MHIFIMASTTKKGGCEGTGNSFQFGVQFGYNRNVSIIGANQTNVPQTRKDLSYITMLDLPRELVAL